MSLFKYGPIKGLVRYAVAVNHDGLLRTVGDIRLNVAADDRAVLYCRLMCKVRPEPRLGVVSPPDDPTAQYFCAEKQAGYGVFLPCRSWPAWMDRTDQSWASVWDQVSCGTTTRWGSGVNVWRVEFPADVGALMRPREVSWVAVYGPPDAPRDRNAHWGILGYCHSRKAAEEAADAYTADPGSRGGIGWVCPTPLELSESAV